MRDVCGDGRGGIVDSGAIFFFSFFLTWLLYSVCMYVCGNTVVITVLASQYFLFE